jgi:hypothetical protein
MLRFRVLVSTAPLIAAALLARVEFLPRERPCIAAGAATVQLATSPWHPDLQVSFTDDPARATVRVALTDDPGRADFAVVDDAADQDDGACAAGPAAQFVAISAARAAASPVIYLAPEGPADYLIFVKSKTFSARDAAALIVGARGLPLRLAAARQL